MATTTVYPPITITSADIGAGEWADDSLESIRTGITGAIANAGIEPLVKALDRFDDPEHPGVKAFEVQVADEVAAEVAPAVAALIDAAITKRLPWTWEPER